MKFCTVINCIDGRVQLPVIKFLQKRFNVDYVDSISEIAPSLILLDEKKSHSILERVNVSIEKHHSVGIAIVGHHDCAKNPAPKFNQLEHIKSAIEFLRQQYDQIKIIGLWVDENWIVHEVDG